METLEVNALGLEGELVYITDTKNIFVHDGTMFQPIQTVDMMVVHEEDFVFHDGEPVISY